jgi:hypothetical protein
MRLFHTVGPIALAYPQSMEISAAPDPIENKGLICLFSEQGRMFLAASPKASQDLAEWGPPVARGLRLWTEPPLGEFLCNVTYASWFKLRREIRMLRGHLDVEIA